MHRPLRNLILIVLALLLAACDPGGQNPAIRVRVRVDGKELVFSATEPISVGQLLQRENISLGGFDRLNPSDFTPLSDGLLITVVRVENRSECVEESVPYAEETIKTLALQPGQTRVLQPGVAGSVRVCFDVLLEDGVEKSRVQSSRTILTPPRNQMVALGVDNSRVEPVPVAGLLAYISGGQANYMQDSSTNQATLPTNGNLDGFVFALAPDSRALLYTRKPDQPDSAVFNELWILFDPTNPDSQPVRLIIDNVLTAEWIPGEPFTFSYSTLQPRSEPPGYQALNDLYRARLDSTTGKILKAERIINTGPQSVYALWGTVFEWSPDGKQLAWAQAEGVGLVDLQRGTLRKLVDLSIYQTTLSRGWLWVPSLAWSPDGVVLAAAVHGKPLGSETDETSPVFDLAMLRDELVINPAIERTGMWAAPQFSPLAQTDAGRSGSIAYLQARTPNDSVNSEYDLVIADRDGSNARIVFPGKNRPGIVPFEDRTRNAKITWSPDGKQITLIYQGDIHIIDIESGRATRVTVVGNALSPRWVR